MNSLAIKIQKTGGENEERRRIPYNMWDWAKEWD